MTRLPAALSAIAFVSAGLLTGCSGGDGSDYCNQVRDNAEDDTLDNLDPSDPDALKTFITEAKKLQAGRPRRGQGRLRRHHRRVPGPDQRRRGEGQRRRRTASRSTTRTTATWTYQSLAELLRTPDDA